MDHRQLPVGASALVLGLLVALAGSFTDDLLGGQAIVGVLQIVLWIAGGLLMLAGTASTISLRAAERERRARRSGRLPTPSS